MKLGLIGKTLKHSWSPEIHKNLIGEDYQLWELAEEELDDFFAKKDFDGINVTIPYKKTVMRYLDAVDPTAEKAGAVNCVVNRDGILRGYNTDVTGFIELIKANYIDVKNKKCAVLGSGGAASAVCTALEMLDAEPVMVSRHNKLGCIDYADLKEKKEQFKVVINATPVGMYPDNDSTPVDLAEFENLEAAVDVVANPLRTRFLFEAKMLRVRNAGGFEMLVRQAQAADELFTGKKPEEEKVIACMNTLLREKRNIVLIGMPTSGKTTVTDLLAVRTGIEKIEMDEELVKMLGTSIRECFDTKGEQYFRDKETELAKSLRHGGGKIISCGGGVIKREENMRYLSENGIIIWLSRDPENLYPTDSRPLSATRESIDKLYAERRALYDRYSDVVLDNNGPISSTLNEIMGLVEG